MIHGHIGWQKKRKACVNCWSGLYLGLEGRVVAEITKNYAIAPSIPPEGAD